MPPAEIVTRVWHLHDTANHQMSINLVCRDIQKLGRKFRSPGGTGEAEGTQNRNASEQAAVIPAPGILLLS